MAASEARDETGAPGARAVSVPVCRLAHHGDRLVATLHGAGPTRRLVMKQASPTVLSRLAASHRRALVDGPDPIGPLPISATEVYLHAIHQLISVYLVDLLTGLPRVALVLDSDLLSGLPIETAHRPGRPALFEVTQCFRLLRPWHQVPVNRRTRRRFRLEQHTGRSIGLDALPLEQTLVAAAHVSTFAAGPIDNADRLVHIAGHHPTPADDRAVNGEAVYGEAVYGEAVNGEAGHGEAVNGTASPRIGSRESTGPHRSRAEAAHLVLSGCDSLPTTLPVGVASVVGSLWPVDDQQSVTVMAAYHARLALGIGPLESLRQTQLLHRPLSPDVWASFVYLGHPD